MKTPRKKLTNKDLENRDNIIMMEVENVKRTQDSMFMTIVDYIEYKGDIENLKKYMAKKYKEDEDVQPKLQKSSS
jgi:CRISPR/Cas system-associated endoribonuclease Cas2